MKDVLDVKAELEQIVATVQKGWVDARTVVGMLQVVIAGIREEKVKKA